MISYDLMLYFPMAPEARLQTTPRHSIPQRSEATCDPKHAARGAVQICL